MKKKKQQILVIAAHPDDEIACAGTLMKMRDCGFEINELVLTGGGEGGNVAGRENEMRKAGELLGIKEMFFFEQEDLGLTYSKELMMRVVAVIREVKPEVVILMHKEDFHPDHRAAFAIGIEAVKFAATGVRVELGEKHRTKVVMMMGGMWPIRPHLMVDVTKYKDKKMQMFALHESQVNQKAVNFELAMMTIYGYQHRTGEDTLAEPFEFCSEFPCSGMVNIDADV